VIIDKESSKGKIRHSVPTLREFQNLETQ